MGSRLERNENTSRVEGLVCFARCYEAVSVEMGDPRERARPASPTVNTRPIVQRLPTVICRWRLSNSVSNLAPRRSIFPSIRRNPSRISLARSRNVVRRSRMSSLVSAAMCSRMATRISIPWDLSLKWCVGHGRLLTCWCGVVTGTGGGSVCELRGWQRQIRDIRCAADGRAVRGCEPAMPGARPCSARTAVAGGRFCRRCFLSVGVWWWLVRPMPDQRSRAL